MSTLSSISFLPSLSQTSLGGTAVRGATAAGTGSAARSGFENGAEAVTGMLHVGTDSHPRAIEDIERDFLAALCESNPA